MREKERDLFKCWLNYQAQPVFSKDQKRLNFYDYVKQLGFKDIADNYVKIRNNKQEIKRGKEKAKQSVNDVINFMQKRLEKQG